VLKEDGSLLFHLIPGVFERADMERGFRHLKKVHGDCTTRPETTGTKNVLQQYTDGSDTNMLRAPKEVTEEYRKKGCRASILGFMGPGGLHKYCRQTAWTAEDPEVLRNALPLIRGANRVFKEYAPPQYRAQEDRASKNSTAVRESGVSRDCDADLCFQIAEHAFEFISRDAKFFCIHSSLPSRDTS
jgi:hypothetical protein